MAQKINNELLKLQEEWLEQCHAEKLASIYPLSRPFLFAVNVSRGDAVRRCVLQGVDGS